MSIEAQFALTTINMMAIIYVVGRVWGLVRSNRKLRKRMSELARENWGLNFRNKILENRLKAINEPRGLARLS